jgi:hypothetical protein
MRLLAVITGWRNTRQTTMARVPPADVRVKRHRTVAGRSGE